MKIWLLPILGLVLAGCASAALNFQETTDPPEPAPLPQTVHLDDLGPAPELQNDTWLNTAVALRLEDLRGQVVLLDMWTFG